jgi:hypothetical protein
MLASMVRSVINSVGQHCPAMRAVPPSEMLCLHEGDARAGTRDPRV